MHRLPLTIALLFTGATRIPAQITADMTVSHGGTPLGTITLELDHVKAPMATANFIGLASGKLSWVDSATGVVRHNTPYYDGIIFHRVIAGFMNQGGSQNGNGTDGPGYSFQDGSEITNGLDHSEAYRISMANSGPDTNGSQFFLTVEPTPWLDGKHIVFGKVRETGNSRGIVDQINSVPVIDPDGPDNIPNTPDDNNRPVKEVRIDSVTVHYNGVDFDPSAQRLPVVFNPAIANPIDPSTTSLDFVQPAGSTFHLAYSSDMVNWRRTFPRTVSCIASPLSSFPLPGAATGNLRQFFQPALVTYHPDFLIPPDLANRTLTVLVPTFSDSVPITFDFNATGTAGTWSWPEIAESGTALFYEPYSTTLNSAFTTLDLAGAATLRYWRFDRLRPTDSTPTEVSGTHRVILYDIDGNFFGRYTGTFTLTK